jgi:hypothetical protein
MQNRRNAKLIVYLLMLFSMLITAWFLSRRNVHREVKKTKTDVRVSASMNHGFHRDIDYLEYTKHARCRMDCRKISETEVKEIMEKGAINYRKSNVKADPCPVYALEGVTTEDDQRVRIVFAQCDRKTKVVTCIDLDHEFKCACK